MQQTVSREKQRKTGRRRVRQAAASVLYKLDALRDTSAGKKMLAELRNSINRPLSGSIGTWGQISSWLPADVLGRGQNLTKEEQAIIAALQLYALHQQSQSSNVTWLPKVEKEVGAASEPDPYRNMGTALSKLRSGGNSVAADRRFNAMIMASTFAELANHLRQLIKLLKAKSDTKVDYPQLAEDLFWVLAGADTAEQVKIRWAKEYYREHNQKGEDDHE